MMSRLLIRPRPFYDETAASILIRTAKENGHESVYQLLAGRGLTVSEGSLRAVIIDPDRFYFLAKQLDLSEEAGALCLKRALPSRRASRIYCSVAIPDRCFRRDDARAFCALCLAEFPYWRQQWLVRPFSVCTQHKRLLIDRCIQCKRFPSIARGEITTCNYCRSSLLSMHGVIANVDAMRTIEDMLKLGDTKPVFNAIEFWSALARFDGLENTPANENFRLRIAVQYLQGEVAAFEHVVTRVVQRIPITGPRIQLIPFLSGGPALMNFAEEVLSHVAPLTQIGAAESRLSYLSKSEVCTILKMPLAKLTELITRGIVSWPANGGRQQKIAITERELLQNGFSQTEILYSYPERSRDFGKPMARRVRTTRHNKSAPIKD